MSIPLIPTSAPRESREVQRFMQDAGKFLNSLIRDGVFQLTGQNTWGIANLFYGGSGPPASSLGYTGDFYLDFSGGVLYQKQ